jgi:hypothetical protein
MSTATVRANKFAGKCATCKQHVPAGTGQLTGNRADGWKVRHLPATWQGSPVSGSYAGGCPEPGTAPAPATERAPRNDSRRLARGQYGYRGHAGRSARCEDSPCCGCCD